MNAREIALAKVQTKKEKELEAIRLAEENKKYQLKQGEELSKVIDCIARQFEPDFLIEYKKSINSSYGYYIWQFFRYQRTLFYLILSYESRKGRFSDESDIQEWSQWEVVIEVPDFRNGKYNHRIGLDTSQDFYCARIEEEFEERFGEYMAKWYE
jgi:hypothetical protein